jgi:glucan 1,3-beta-glucosidase
MNRLVPLLAFLVTTLAAFAIWRSAGQPVTIVDAPGPRLPCVSYAPYREGQTPFDEDLFIAAGQIEEDLRLLATRTDCVRTYSTQQGLGAVVPIAEALGLKVMLGIWIGREPEKNRIELNAGIDLAKRHPETVKAVIVGNEVLLRREQPPSALIAMIREVDAQVSVPVTYADVWEFWLENREVAQAVDFITFHTLPYWEDEPVGIDGAVDHIEGLWRMMEETFVGKPVFIGEAGWPSAGRMREAARPSLVNQARFVREMLNVAQRHGDGINLIEAFDQPWKRKLEGTVGGAWGLFGADRAPKFPLEGPVPADPRWRATFAQASTLAGLALLAAVIAGARVGPWGWLVLAAALQASAGLVVLGWSDLTAAADTPRDWIAGLVRILLAAAAVAGVAIALIRPSSPIPAPTGIAAVLDVFPYQERRPPGDRVALALGAARFLVLLTAAATTLALIADPRYRDFPTAVTLVPAAAFALLSLWNGQTASGPPAEERLLAWVLLVGAVAIVASEGLANVQSLGWSAAVVLLAAAVLRPARRLRPVAEPSP